MDCYACDQAASKRCSRCGNPYCRDHGDEQLCGECLDPMNAAPSGTVFRASVLGLLVGSVLALWLLIRPPSLPGESSGAVEPIASPLAALSPTPTPAPTAAPPTPTPAPPAEAPPPEQPPPAPAGPIEYTVVEGDTWYGIADAYGVEAEQLAAFNGRTLDDFIQPDEVLLIPQ